MDWIIGDRQKIQIKGVSLEGECFGVSPQKAPTIVLLHEGLGSISLWRDFPQNLAAATGCGVFAYSRQGYGHSDPVQLPRPVNYMDLEAEAVVGDVLDYIGAQQVILCGHSDGASIAAIYGGRCEDDRVMALILMAPHFFAEPISISAISKALNAYEGAALRGKLREYHKDVDGAFYGWCKSWLNPDFLNWSIEKDIMGIEVPVLFIQGMNDQYGTLAQLDAVEAYFEQRLTTCLYQNCGHAPHQECERQVLADVASFIKILVMGDNTDKLNYNA
jgi:pimeloyl-ACP methyl ester carboxylesterase